jgi:hypothetical protein
MRNLRKIAGRVSAATARVAAFFWPALAAAQTAPDQPTLKSAAPIWLGLLIIAGLLIIVMVVTIMPSKRGHQD